MKKQLSISFFAFALIVTCSCSSSPNDKPGGGELAAGKQSGAFDQKAALESAPSTSGIHLIDAGSGEKKRARYILDKIEDAVLVMRLQMNMAMTIDGNKMPFPKTPTTVMPMKITAGDLKDGWLSVKSVYESIRLEDTDGVPEQLLGPMNSTYKALENIEMSWEFDNRGSVRNLDYSVGTGVPPQIQQILEQTKQSFATFFVVLPEEEIGVGARWIVVLKDFSVGGMSQELRALYELKDFSNDKLSVDVTMLSLVEEQEMKNQAMPANVTTKVLPAKNYSKGTIQLDLGKLIPISEVQGNANFVMLMSGGPLGEKTQRLESAVDVNISCSAG